MYKVNLEKAEEPIASIHWIIDKAREFQKNIFFIDYAKDFDWMYHNCGKLLKRWEYQNTLPSSWETCMQVKKQQLELDMEKWTGSKLEKEYVKPVYCHPAYLTSMQSASCRVLGWVLQTGIKTAGRNINNLRYKDDTMLMV